MKPFNSLNLAVVGHIEWVTFLSVNKLPSEGLISHGSNLLEEPAGGGAVAGVQMANLTKEKVHFFTSLGNDNIGKICAQRLEELGLIMHIAWRNQPTRRAISLIDSSGERAITVIGERLQPKGQDKLPWEILNEFDGVFITAADGMAINLARQAQILCATPRVKIENLNSANIELDALIGSGLDPDEQIKEEEKKFKTKIKISTEGALGGKVEPGGRYKALKLNKKIVDTYGCGDSFAAGVTVGLAGGLDISKAIEIGAKCGAECTARFGPYN
ncbi:PfkB family carbohydrate kinase [Prochlorococcus marinus]|uniref:PfkB family carbohydrate kinase n=1 Tax=Prochlorococcus marinus TaxID=1219 RepID=UPI0022B4CB1B|nr:PfkB family carbohydrate kinase [Prochlorococcus marinus]